MPQAQHIALNRAQGGPPPAMTYLEIFVCHFLILCVHGLRWRSRLRSDEEEEDEGDADAVHGVTEDHPVFTGGWEGTGTVRSEGDPVGCRDCAVSHSEPRETPLEPGVEI